MTIERDNAKEIARKEIEIEKRQLEDKIASLYQEITQNNINRDQLMAQLHSRLKINIQWQIMDVLYYTLYNSTYYLLNILYFLVLE